MLKKRDLHDSHVLYELMVDPAVFPFVRQKAYSYEEYLFLTKQTIEAEERGELISRTILDEWGNPIGTITLFDVQEKAGFLGTWLGKPYHGKGYNKLAKDSFFSELFYELDIETIFMRIRKINANEEVYNLYEIPKDQYTLATMRDTTFQDAHQLKEA